MKLLLVEDDNCIAEDLAEDLTYQNHVVDLASDGEAGWELVEAFAYDLLLLDVTLPKLGGIELCQRLRRGGYKMPILLMNTHENIEHKVMGLDAGADDYLLKPFDLQELAARIRALLRRGNSIQPPILEWGDLTLNPSSCEVRYAGQPLHPTPKEYCLLELFLRHGLRVFSRGAIVDQLWPFEDPPEEDTVKAHIKGLRQKLKSVGASADLIQTVYGLGYRLNPNC